MPRLRVLVAPTAFKGTASPSEVADAIVSGWRRVRPSDEIVALPVADGGDGTVDVLAAGCGGRWIRRNVRRPTGESARAYALLLPSGDVVMEMAAAAGLALVGERRDPLRYDTRGVGELIELGLEEATGNVYVGLGGSATVDGGAGCAQALGVRFRDRGGRELEPVPAELASVTSIDVSKRREGTERVVGLADVRNTLLGAAGAAPVYGPQKGASPVDVGILERSLTALADATGSARHLADEPGAGAAGGLGFGILALLGGRLAPGADTILDLLGFDEALARADLVVTGEGQLDDQTPAGKAPAAVASRAQDAGVRCLAVVGSDRLGEDEWGSVGLEQVVALDGRQIEAGAAELAGSMESTDLVGEGSVIPTSGSA